MRIKYDPDANALYVKLTAAAVADTVEIEPMVVVDVDATGQPVGIEFVYAQDFLPFLARHGGQLDHETLAPLAAAQRDH
jgi:uncharacterized protein YuzE